MPTMPPRAILALLLGTLALAPFAAQCQAGPGQLTLYRCGPQGRELRSTPCPQEPGASQVLHYAPDDAQAAAAARERIRREGLLIERQTREREAREHAERQALERSAPGVSMGPQALPLDAATVAPAPPAPQRRAGARHGKPPAKTPHTAQHKEQHKELHRPAPPPPVQKHVEPARQGPASQTP